MYSFGIGFPSYYRLFIANAWDGNFLIHELVSERPLVNIGCRGPGGFVTSSSPSYIPTFPIPRL
ncbi:hypothetical protein CY34DRAFT_813196 [Suillus luteus UH-Slu-Lm8-n1]|uniref:Uncharacterized protein n=1 Tax=Suillus luteus UH-Slu-Lm8-n1 TaxID=930992 RepID=A0A0D0AII7_9AGAM|nr:hypothetical protein CY34DRAFT_813196 [Suillus luteus UH-Slu-Lm8-n1]